MDSLTYFASAVTSKEFFVDGPLLVMAVTADETVLNNPLTTVL
jgi:hypothetical protein